MGKEFIYQGKKLITILWQDSDLS